ncbi:MAG TPA: DNA cytosine methyltransferase [Rhodoglobus sp.]|nr:DNA cytosine methyltransferase [Rhodoglobus sp.]
MAVSSIRSHSESTPRVAEFFAGIGLARIGLEAAGFRVPWSNDIEKFKRDIYAANFDALPFPGEHEFKLADISTLGGSDVPDIELAWASFPCTDLSLAGARAGLAGTSSSTFYQFIRVLDEMGERAPRVVALENVHGLATSHGGEDIAAAIRALNELGYSVDVLSIDARRFVPQSRPRLFLIGAKNPPAFNETLQSDLRPDFLQSIFADSALRTHRGKLPALPEPLVGGLAQEVEAMSPDDARWWDEERRHRFVSSLSPLQTSRFERLRDASSVSYRTAYRRTRGGTAVWEIRPDDISGCLRTARGGSSKQAIVELGKGSVRVRWMTPREYARLMGAGDFKMDAHSDSQYLFGFGDAVCAPAVAWVGRHYLMPLVRGEMRVTSPALAVVNG